ncbi:unnamed protein product [Mytilus coruscus]|uniref:Uncharacterized protein n=1 Tax=Mytilus coruscus TaxID=42192 RepID=A0A6J8EMZ6_MYTCO|nr:unnamed protein product [Mytilus coruscus]
MPKQCTFRLVDHVTKSNMELITRLRDSDSDQLNSAWYFNCAVYWKTEAGRRLKFDIFDDIDKRLNHGDSRGTGVCVMFRGGYDYEVHESLIDQHGRYIILDLTLYDQRLTLVCLYGYNTDKPEFFCDILQKTMRFSKTSFIFLGDWNVVQDKNDYTYNVIHDRNPNSRRKIDEIKENTFTVRPLENLLSK